MDKKGEVSRLGWYDTFLAFVFISVGLVPVLGKYVYPGLGFLQGSILEHRLLLGVLLCIGGLFLFYNSFLVSKYKPKRLNKIVVGFLMLVLGVLPLILEYNLLAYIGFPFQYSVMLEVLQGLVVFFGIYVLVDAFMLKSHY